ncbi:hypothetical protein ACFXDJ_06375 [Streptomyces sp. NPDC059443]|uniref:hypothetical protein n=1 Tax=unclassified Streptomyces TaxID=2593676 RepID=UPI00367D68CD
MTYQPGRLAVIAASMAGMIALTGCSSLGEIATRQPPCKTVDLSSRLRERYSLPELPKADEIRFCESSDRDGYSASLAFRSTPEDSRAYLTNLGMDPAEFIEIESTKVDRLAQPDGDSWALTRGLEYKTGMKSIGYNGHCLVDYNAFIENATRWDGRVYIGMYCQT